MIDIGIFLVLLILGYLFGRFAEKKHYRSIIQRESESKIMAFSARYPEEGLKSKDASLAAGNVVISIDYFKRILAGLRAIFGGNVTAYESLIDRARREAVLRMKEDAENQGATRIFNVKIETSSISKGANNQVGAVEVLAYGTAFAD